MDKQALDRWITREPDQWDIACPKCGSIEIADDEGYAIDIDEYGKCLDCGYLFLATDENLTHYPLPAADVCGIK